VLRGKGRRLFRTLFISLAIASLASCSFSVRPIYKDEEKKTAGRAVALLHAQINAEQYDAIYDGAHDVLKNASSKAEFSSVFKQAREITGKILEVTQHWENVIIGAPVQVRAVYNVKCENGNFEEWFNFIMSTDGKNALLASYHIQPGSASPSEMEQMIEKERLKGSQTK
jgi:hypothetical protein